MVRQVPGRRTLSARLIETLKFYGPLGFTAFGGPSANLVLIRKIFVLQEKWVDDTTFQDLLALGNALPGPAFSQCAFAISALRGGTLAALLSFILLTAPGMIMMMGIGFGVRKIPNTLPDIVFALFTGLNAAAIGLVSLAAYQLSCKVITDKATRLLVLFSGSIAACYEAQWLYPVLMVAGGLTTFTVDRVSDIKAQRKAKKDEEERRRLAAETSGSFEAESPTPVTPEQAGDIEMEIARPIPAATKNVRGDSEGVLRRTAAGHGVDSIQRYPTPPLEANQSRPGSQKTRAESTIGEEREEEEEEEEVYFGVTIKQGLIICGVFFALLISLLVAKATTPHKRALDFTTNIILSGTIIFGGGPVVIPLLRGYTVDPGWVTPRDFLLGFALIQALPGPLFNFAAFLGVLVLPEQPILGGLLGTVAIFLPGIMLKLGVLPLYQKWKAYSKFRSALRGLNAGAIGLIYSAVYRLFRVGFVRGSTVDPNVLAVVGSLDQDGFWLAIIAFTFVGCGSFNVPSPVAILLGAVGGMAWYGVASR